MKLNQPLAGCCVAFADEVAPLRVVAACATGKPDVTVVGVDDDDDDDEEEESDGATEDDNEGMVDPVNIVRGCVDDNERLLLLDDEVAVEAKRPIGDDDDESECKWSPYLKDHT
jgi:hypothetical protein